MEKVQKTLENINFRPIATFADDSFADEPTGAPAESTETSNYFDHFNRPAALPPRDQNEIINDIIRDAAHRKPQERHVDVKLVPESILQTAKPSVYVVEDTPSENSVDTGSAPNEKKTPPKESSSQPRKPVYIVDDEPPAKSKDDKTSEAKEPKSPRDKPNQDANKKPPGESSISQLLKYSNF